MIDATLSVDLILMGPVLSRATEIGNPGIDTPMARLHEKGPFCIPASLVRGCLRQSLEELESIGFSLLPFTVTELFGAESGNGSNTLTSFEPARRRLNFTDFALTKKETDMVAPRSRTRIDRARGSAMKMALQVMEMPLKAGEQGTFSGRVSYWAKDAAEAATIQDKILTGLRWTTSFGGERTSGYGRLIEVNSRLDSRMVQAVSFSSAVTVPQLLGLAVRPYAPFCLSKRRTTGNLFESEDFISGSAIRGSLATTLNSLLGRSGPTKIDGNIQPEWAALGLNFNKIRFSHAFPAAESALKRPVFPPLSLVRDSLEKKVFDIALKPGPELFGNPPRAPKFRIDWKGGDADAFAYCGWISPQRELIVHTKMNANTRRAEEQSLFAYEMVRPEGRLWLGSIDLSGVPDKDRSAVTAQLRALISLDLRSLGKTNTRAKADIIDPPPPYHPCNTEPLDDKIWIITLQTPCLLCDPANLNEMSGQKDLEEAYRAIWSDLSGNQLALVRYFATQSLSGGVYLARRFRSGKPYNPFLLTDAGSVFVLTATEDTANVRAVINGWLAHGLPLPAWASDRYGNDYSSCPFMPEDGYGEIAVNLPCHLKTKPEEAWYAVS